MIKKINIDNDRSIVVLDDAFTFSEISGNYTNSISKNFKIYNSSESEIQNLSDKRLGSVLTEDDPVLNSIFSKERLEIIKEYIPQNLYTHWRSYINLGIVSDSHKIHVDDFSIGGGFTLLYYANRNWDPDWGGETLFYDDKREEIKFVSPFVPGRIIIFDSSIPHSAKPQHLNGPTYRFTVACKFLRNR